MKCPQCPYYEQKTSYGTTFIMIEEKKISAIYCHKSENASCLEVPYEEIIVNGLHIKA